MTELLIGVDGGNSKTDVAVADAAGHVLSHVRGPGSSPEKLGVHGAADVIDELVEAVLNDPAVPRDAQPIALATLLAGLDLPEDAPATEAVLKARHPELQLVVDNDTAAVLMAGTNGGPGVAVVCGAGINAAGLSHSGARSGFLSLGQFSGDWGGGLALGREIVWWAARGEDGRSAPTALQGAVCNHFGVPRVIDVVLAVHRTEIAPGRLVELVPALLTSDTDGDATARTIVDRLAHEIADMARVMLERSELLGVRVPVVLAGGVLTSGHERLLTMVRDDISRAAPHARVHVLHCRPVAGALVSALRAAPRLRPGDLEEAAARITASPLFGAY